MKSNNCSAWQIARTLRDACSTITRELSRFCTWSDRPELQANTPAAYCARAGGLRARLNRFKCRKRFMLAIDTTPFGVVQRVLSQGRSPSQIAGTLERMWLDVPQRTVSHESIYTSIYAMPKGGLRKDLIACMRRAKAKLVPRSQGEDRRGQMSDMLNIHLPSGQVDSPSRRADDQYRRDDVLMRSVQPLAARLLREHQWLIRQYLPNCTVLSVHSQEQLDAIADLLNDRPCAMHGL